MTYNIRNAKGMDNKTDYERTARVLRNNKADVIAVQEADSVTKRSNGDDVLKILAEKTSLHHTYGAAISYQGGMYGVGILSKKKPVYFYTVSLPGKEEKRILLVAVFKKYVIFCTHLSLTEADRISSVDIINKESGKFTRPVYLAGDLNAEPSSAAITVLKQTWIQLSSNQPTFPASVPNKCIDYIFSLNNAGIKIRTSSVIEEPMASDHRPVFIEVKN